MIAIKVKSTKETIAVAFSPPLDFFAAILFTVPLLVRFPRQQKFCR